MNLQLFAEEKTESATPRRRQEARKKGQVVKSAELNSAINLLVLTLLFLAISSFLFNSFRNMLVGYLNADNALLTAGNIPSLISRAVGHYFLLMGPIFLAAVSAGLLTNYLQVGFLFTTESINPQLNRLNPLEGLKRMVSKRAIFELIKALLKVSLIALVSFMFVYSHLEDMLVLIYQETRQVWYSVSKMILDLSLRVATVFIALAVLDYIYQRYEHNQNLRMTKQEVKEEMRQMEGDPQLRAKLREKQRQVAMQRMMQEIPSATVVITNPTELAVALRYLEEEDGAPVLVAKGAGVIAGKIREAAAEHGVPLLENKEVARLLYSQVDIGHEIPVDLYQAVAEILAVVYRMKK